MVVAKYRNFRFDFMGNIVMEKLNKLKNILKKSVKIGVAITLGTMLMGCPNPNGPQNPDNPGIEKPEPGKEQDEYGIPSDKILGNGNYIIHSFIGEENSHLRAGQIAKDVNHYLGKGETYVKGLVNQFSNSLKDRPAAEAYFAQFINEEQNNEFQRMNEALNESTYSFDKTIKGVAQPSVYIFENIIRNIDNNRDRAIFIRLYHALSNEAYKYGLGSYADVPSSQKNKYEHNREIINNAWTASVINNYFDINQDIDQQNCQQTTNEMDRLLNKAVKNMGNDVTVRDLQQVINIATTANSLGAMHDLSTSALKHTSCSAENNIIDAMEELGNKMYWDEQNNSLYITK